MLNFDNISLALNKYHNSYKYGYPSDEELIELRDAIALAENLSKALNSGNASNYYYRYLFDLINQVCRARNLPDF